MKKLLLLLLVSLSIVLMTGCKDATRAQFNAPGKRHHITLYSGGKMVGEWISTGNVINNQSQSDGWYFEDEKTGRLVEIAGTLSIEVLP